MSKKYRRPAATLAATSVFTLGFALACTDASAQDAAQPALARKTSTADNTVVVITGFRKSYADAVAAKRRNIEITDSISSDGLGRFPDLNVGEALQRIPGVQLNREAGSRDATINLRGLPGEYARMTMNGVSFASPILTSSTPLGAFDSDIFSALAVEKSPMANAQAGGLSGNIDLQIAPALSRKDGGFAKAGYEYDSLGKLESPNFTIGYNKHFGSDFAVFGVLAYRKEQFRRDTLIFNNYNALNYKTTPNFAALYSDYYAPFNADGKTCPAGKVCAPTGTGKLSDQGVLFMSQPRQDAKFNGGDLYSSAFGMEWRVNDNLKVGTTGFYTYRNNNESVEDLEIISFTPAATVVTPTQAPIKASDGTYVINNFNFSNAAVTSSSRSAIQLQESWGVDLNVDWHNDKWRLSTIATLSRAQNHGNQVQMDFDPNPAQINYSGSFSSGAGDFSQYALSMGPNPAVTNASSTGSWYWADPRVNKSVNPSYWYDTANGAAGGANYTNRFNLSGTQRYLTNTVNAIQQDVERFINWGPLTSLQGGLKYEDNRYVARGYRNTGYGIHSEVLSSSSFFGPVPYTNFLGGTVANYNPNWQAIDVAYALSNLAPAAVYPGGGLTPNGFNIKYNDPNFSLQNFTNDYKIASAYLQGKFKSELFSVPLRGNFGLRYESTDNPVSTLDQVTSSGDQLGSLGNFKTNHYHNTYSYWLPSGIIVADLGPDLMLRGAAYRTYVRPQPWNFTPVTLITPPTSGTVYTVTLGNPDLQPYLATSYDISLEWYNRPNGMVALDVFQKRVTGLITTVKGAANLCPADGSAWGLGTLTREGDTCYTSLPPDASGNRYSVTASGYINSPNPITVRGVEFDVQQNLDFLPGFWKNFGGGMNYAYTELSGTALDGTKARLPGISKHNVNLIGYYETKTFGIRLVYNYRSKYDLADTSSFSGTARSVKARGQLDASASYNINERISVSFDAFNMTDATRYEYENDGAFKPRNYTYDGKTYQLTLKASF